MKISLKQTKINKMNTQFQYFDTFKYENGFSLFANDYDNEPNHFGSSNPNEVFLCLEPKYSPQVEQKDKIENSFQEFGTDTESKNYNFNLEITSMKCENEDEIKPQCNHQSQEGTNSTFEAETTSVKSSKRGYENLFLMVEDKNLYTIGSEEDELTTENNKDLVNLDAIISNNQTNLNNFIDDLLKSCPCDNLVKKQRIYKAKNIKRKRKTKSQINILENELQKNSVWLKEDFKQLSKSLGLNRDQVYKWYWDQKKKSDF